MSDEHPLKQKWDQLHRSGYLDSLWDVAKAMSVPFWWHSGNPAALRILHNGTLCIVDSGVKVFGVTAEHVYRAYLMDRHTDERFVCQFGSLTVWPERRVIDFDRNIDLATFDLPEFVGRAERFLSNRMVKWPPPRLKARDAVIYGGFPGVSGKAGVERSTLAFDTVTGFVHDVTDQNIVLFPHYQNIYWPGRQPGQDVNTNPGGVSGGPVYYVDESGSEYSYLELAGFIYEYFEPFETVLARFADVIRPDGTLVR